MNAPSSVWNNFSHDSFSLPVLKQSWCSSVTLDKQEAAFSFSRTINLSISTSASQTVMSFSCQGWRSCVPLDRGLRGWSWSECGMADPRRAVDVYRCLLVKLGSACVDGNEKASEKKGLASCRDTVAYIKTVCVNESQSVSWCQWVTFKSAAAVRRRLSLHGYSHFKDVVLFLGCCWFFYLFIF